MILVTGGTGLVGSHLLYKLITSNNKVRAIYRDEKKLRNVKNVFSSYSKNYETLFNSIEWVEADLLDITSLFDAFINVSYVYHCAAFVSFEPDAYALLRKTNIEGTANIVNLSISNNINKFCHVSSIATLGVMPNKKPITESAIWNSELDNSYYAITKYGAEMEVWRATQEGLDAVIVNPGVIIGAGIWDSGTGTLFKKAYRGLKYYTTGTIALVGVEDVVLTMINLMNSNVVNERFVLVAENLTYKKFLEFLAESVNRKQPKKIASSLLLKTICKLDWLKTLFTGKKRVLTKHIVTSLTSNTKYDSDKIRLELNMKFMPMESYIIKVGSLFLKQV